MRTAKLERATLETQIELELNLDGQGRADIATGVGFLDHMLTLLAFHSDFDLTVRAHGDYEGVGMDTHHVIEDVAILLGQALRTALGDRLGIQRYGNFTIPMDEALLTANLDISGRPYLVLNADLSGNPQLGNFDTEMTEDFFRALAMNAGITLHLNEQYGTNTHHIIEGFFKATAHALKLAVEVDPTKQGQIPSSKGML